MAEGKENRQWVLKQHPKGVPTDEDVVMVTSPMPVPGDDEILVKNHYISVDPYQRGRMTGRRHYADPTKLDDVIIGGGVGSVIKSSVDDFPVGTIVSGIFGWQEYAVVKTKMVVKVDPKIPKLSYAQGVLGMPGATAYFGLLRVIEPEKGKTLFVSGAAGAVGSIVGQIGKIEGLRVIGSAGSQAKLDYLKEIGFDASLNYKGKDRDALVADLKEIAPEGIDYYFDNTGGPMTDAVMLSMNTFGKVAVCGQIHGYNDHDIFTVKTEIPLLGYVLRKQISMEGFIVPRWLKEWPIAFEYITKHLVEGNIKARETVTEGFEGVFNAFLGLFKGENTGKQIVHISDPE